MFPKKETLIISSISSEELSAVEMLLLGVSFPQSSVEYELIFEGESRSPRTCAHNIGLSE